MAATQIAKPFHRPGWVYEEKVDGWRILAYKDAAGVRLVSRKGLLRQSPQVARQLLRKLLPEPIVLESTPEGVRFRGRAAWGAVLSGVMQGVGLVVPPG